MKIHFLECFLALLLFASCSEPTDITPLYDKISSLERRIDSLEKNMMGAKPAKEPSSKKKKEIKKGREITYTLPEIESSSITMRETVNNYSSSYLSYSDRCQATTKKGTRSKRTSHSGDYCWQQGG